MPGVPIAAKEWEPISILHPLSHPSQEKVPLCQEFLMLVQIRHIQPLLNFYLAAILLTAGILQKKIL